MFRTLPKPRADHNRELEAGIEWIVARRLAPIEAELVRLRSHVKALSSAGTP